MSNEIRIFENEQFGRVRTIMIDGEPWFVGKDVANCLGYANPQKAIRDHIFEEDRGVNETFTPSGMQNMLVINESGVYSLIFSSKLPTAKSFKRWVTSEILPSIRKHGVYMTGEKILEVMSKPESIIAMCQMLLKEQLKNRELTAQNEELTEKASYLDRILAAKTAVPVTKIAKDYGMSAVRFNEMLHRFGVQYTVDRTWVLYQKYANNGYTQSKTYLISADKSAMQTLWTQKGRLFLYELLKKNGLYPECERVAFES